MLKRSHFWIIGAIILFVLIAIPPHGRFFIVPPHIKELLIFGIICLLAFFAIKTVHAKSRFTGPVSDTAQGTFGHNPGFPPPPHNSQFGFIGPSQTITIAQAQTLEHRTPVVVRGNIIMSLGGDLYTFTDLTTEIILRIGPREWENLGSNISPSDTIEISGELHRDLRDNQRALEIHARIIRKL